MTQVTGDPLRELIRSRFTEKASAANAAQSPTGDPLRDLIRSRMETRGTFTADIPGQEEPSHDGGEAYDPNAVPDNPDAAWAQAVRERGIDPIDAARVEGAVQEARGPQRPPMNLQGAGAPAGGVFDPIGFPNQEPAPLINPNDPSANVWRAQQQARMGKFNQTLSDANAAQQAGPLARIGGTVMHGVMGGAQGADEGWGRVFDAIAKVDPNAPQGHRAKVFGEAAKAFTGMDDATAAEYQNLAEHASTAEQLLGGLYAMPVDMLRPESIAAVIAAGPLSKVAMEGLAPIIEGIAKKSPALAAGVEKSLHGAMGLGAFSGAQAGFEGHGPEDIAKAAASGAVMGAGFGLIPGIRAGAKEARRGSVMAAEAKAAAGEARARSDFADVAESHSARLRADQQAREASAAKPVPEPLPKQGDPARGAVDEQHQQAVEPHAAESTKPRYTVVGYNEADGKPILRLNTQPEKGAPREVPQQEARPAELEPVNAGRESPAAPAAKEEAPPARQEVQGAPVEPAATGGEAAVEGPKPKRKLRGKDSAQTIERPALKDENTQSPNNTEVATGEPAGSAQPAVEPALNPPKARLRSKRAIEAERASLFEQESRASSPSERGAGDAFNAKGEGTPSEPPATAAPETGRIGSETPLKPPLLSKAAKEASKPAPEVKAETFFGRIAKKAREERMALAPPKPRTPGTRSGHGVGLQEVYHLGVEYAARLAEKGEIITRKGAKALRAWVETEAPHQIERWRDIGRVANKLLRDSRSPEGKYDEGRFEAALGKMQSDRAGPDRPIKATIRDVTGMARHLEKKVTAEEAYLHGLKKEASGAAKGYREGKKAGYEKADRELTELHERTYRKLQGKALKQSIVEREKGRAALEKAEADADVGEGIRKQVVSLVKEHVPPVRRGEYLNAAASADSMPKLRDVISRVQHTLADVQMREAVRLAKDAAKGIKRRKMLQANRALYTAALNDFKKLKTEYQSLKTVVEKQAALKQAEQIRNGFREAKYRQKVEEQVRVGKKVWLRDTLVTQGMKALAEGRKPLRSLSSNDLERTIRAGAFRYAHQINLSRDTVGAMLNHPGLRRLLVEDMWDGEGLVMRDHKRAQDALRTAAEAQGFKWGSDDLQRLSEGASGDAANAVSLTLPDAGEIKASAGEWMSLIATITDADARRNILGGAGVTWARHKYGDAVKLTQADMEQAILKLNAYDPRLLKIVGAMKRHLESEVRPGVFEAHRQQTGWDLEPVEQYWPTARNRVQPPPETLVGAGPQYVKRALESLSFLQERAPDTKTPYLVGDFFDTFNDHTYKAAVWTHMTKRVRNAELVFRDPRMMKEVQRYFGDQMNGQIERQIEAGKLIYTEPKRPGEKIAAMLNKNISKAALLVNPSTGLKQLSGVFKLNAVIEPEYVAKGIKGAYSKDVTKIMRESPFFRDRYEDASWRRMTPSLGQRTPLLGDTSLRGSMKRLATGEKVKGSLVRKGTAQLTSRYAALQDATDRIKIIDAADAAVSRVAIAAKLAEAKARGYTGDKASQWASKQASYAVRRTNNTHSPLDMSDFAYRHRGGLASSFIMFTSDKNKSYNLMAQAATAKRMTRAQRVRIVVSLGASTAFSAAVAAGIKMFMDRKDKDGAKKAMDAGAREFASGMLPFYGGEDLVDLGRKIIKAGSGNPGTPQNPDMFQAPALQTIENLGGAAMSIAKAMGAEGRMRSGPNRGRLKSAVYGQQALRKSVESVGDALGVPVKTVWRWIDALSE